MLRDASGNERKGIEVWCDWYQEWHKPIGVCCKHIANSGVVSLNYYQTVRDLMLAGF